MARSSRNLWIWVAGAFALLLGAWALLIYISVRNQPESVPLEPPSRIEGQP